MALLRSKKGFAHRFAASALSAVDERLDASPARFASHRLTAALPWRILHAHYAKTPDAGILAGQAVLIVIGIGRDGRRQVPGVTFVVPDDRAALQTAIRAVSALACRHCCVTCPGNTLDDGSRRVDEAAAPCSRKRVGTCGRRWIRDRASSARWLHDGESGAPILG